MDVEVMEDTVQKEETEIERQERIIKILYGDSSWQVNEQLSIKERNEKKLVGNEYIYGECEIQTMSTLMQLLKNEYGYLQQDGGVFYDLGSGVGKIVFSALLLHNFNVCVGIEILQSLHYIALNAEKRWIEEICDEMPMQMAKTEIRLENVDIMQLDNLENAALVFINSVGFSDMMMQKLCQLVETLPIGSIIITIMKPIISKCYKTIYQNRYPMSWGSAIVYFQKRVA